MKYICDYAKSQGVGIHVWTNWKALYAKLDEALAQFEKWGISGMMVDFMDRDDQEMINIQEEILAKAATHHLFVQFHGSCKPSGLHRTYPNEFTREGTLNYEVYKWDTIINADHDISIPFTRLLAGPTDYHLGGFRAVPRSEFRVHFTHPLVMSTRCHMLAMYVVLESYLSMICDTPDSYIGQPGFDFLQRLPSVWDETKVLNASVNEYITIARKKDGAWYVGTLNNSKARTLKLNLNFLGTGKYTATIYRDADDANLHPNLLVKEEKVVANSDTILLPLAEDGGAVIWIR
jgi:alpha-glucosidase